MNHNLGIFMYWIQLNFQMRKHHKHHLVTLKPFVITYIHSIKVQ